MPDKEVSLLLSLFSLSSSSLSLSSLSLACPVGEYPPAHCPVRAVKHFELPPRGRAPVPCLALDSNLKEDPVYTLGARALRLGPEKYNNDDPSLPLEI